MHSMLCTRVIFVICGLQRCDELDRAGAVAREERKRNQIKIRPKSHCKFNSASTSNTSNESGFNSPLNLPKRCDPSSDLDLDSVYHSEYAIDLDYGYELDCIRDDECYDKNIRGDMESEDGRERYRYRNGGPYACTQSTSVLDTYVTNEDAFAYPYAVYDEDRERGWASAGGNGSGGSKGGGRKDVQRRSQSCSRHRSCSGQRRYNGVQEDGRAQS